MRESRTSSGRSEGLGMLLLPFSGFLLRSLYPLLVSGIISQLVTLVLVHCKPARFAFIGEFDEFLTPFHEF